MKDECLFLSTKEPTYLTVITTSLASHFVSLQASPAGILDRFTPSKFKKKSVSQSTQNGLKCIKMPIKIFFYPFDAPYLPLRSLRSVGLRASRSRFSVVSLPWASRFAPSSYPMTLPGSQGVSMPSFMTIGLKLWALEGYMHTYIHS